MDKNLQQRLAKVLDGNNKEAAWTMGLRYLTEETLCWAMGADYGCVDDVYDVEKFIDAWQSSADYEIVMAGEFEGKADIAVGRDYSNDCVKVTLYGASTEDGDPGLYAALLRYVADWIDKNADAVRNREDADIYLGYPDGFDAPLASGEFTMTEEQKKEAVVTDLVQGMQSGDTYCDICDVCLAWGENIDISFDGRHDDNGDPIPTVRCEECAEKVIA